MRRRAELQRIQQPREARFQLFARIAGDLEGLVHNLGAVVPYCPRRQLDAVADDVVLQGQDVERVFVFERCKAAARHRKRVVAEPDFSGLLVALVERIVDDPAKLEDPLLSRFELVAQPFARRSGKSLRRTLFLTYEEDRIPVPDAGCLLQGLCPLGIEELSDRPLALSAVENDVAETAHALLAGPGVELVEEAARLIGSADCRDRPHDGALADGSGEDLEIGAAPDFGGIGDLDGVA